MKNFLIDPLKQSNSYNKLRENIEKGLSPILSHGIISENVGHITYALNEHMDRQILLVTYDDKRARRIHEDLLNLGSKRARYFPKKELIYYEIDALSNEDYNRRLKILSELNDDEKLIVVTSIETIFDKIISSKEFRKLSRHIKIGDIIDIEELKEIFISSGYERVSLVENIGQFGIRGGIIDFFPANMENPIRIELFDVEVDSIRSFDQISQRSIKNLSETIIIPAKEVLILDEYRKSIIDSIDKDIEYTKENNEFSDEVKEKIDSKFINLRNDIEDKVYISNRDMIIPYIPKDYLGTIVEHINKLGIIYMDEPSRVKEKAKEVMEEYLTKFNNLGSIGELLDGHENIYSHIEMSKEMASGKIYIENSALLSGKSKGEFKSIVKFTNKSTQSYHKKMDLLKEDLIFYRDNDYKIVITSGTEERAVRLSANLTDMKIENLYMKSLNREIKPKEILIVSGSLQGGIEYPEEKFIIINDEDIFGAGKRMKRSRKRKDAKDIVSFTDLTAGDYIVHENHGIGKYEGIEQLNIQGIKKDYLNIRYRDGDRLYVPIDQMHLIQKYIGSDSVKPSVNKLSSAEWAKTKHKARLAVEEMAEELLELYAKREEVEGYAFSKDSNWQRQFEDFFPYEETEGQLRSVEEIKKDMQTNRPMERLLCGDVGYGKTEVALRAAFKAVLDGKQVAFLVPTTILAQQHYNTILERFADFPVKTGMLSRFRTAGEQKTTLEDLSRGMIDIVVGTHRILSKDVKFKDLGLLIVDEEQRFGVKDKEKLKQLKANVDVLTLTATPIPRTLHMSLSGIRDMSVLDEPPEERYPVQTYVVEYNEQIIRDAIIKEISRGGQVYFLHNRVSDIDKVKARLEKLVPEASFGVGHGQMSERILEGRMIDFYDQHFDVLVCTTIIETGLDIPNVNTIIINDADRMGLSQLYQLRGRVGRANRIAYGYFMHARDKVLSEVAERRLLAIKEFTEFGSGFKIAMRDLEIRGAGNLLGSQQHGQIEAIGYDLYVKFLNETVKKLKGEEVEEIVDTIIDLEKDGYIKDNYISDEEQKVNIYKKIASVETVDHYRELIDELIDRYGDLPREVENLIDISYIRALGSSNNIKSIIQSTKDVRFFFAVEENIDPDLISFLADKFGYRINFFLRKNPNFVYSVRKDVLKELKDLLESIDGFNNKNYDI